MSQKQFPASLKFKFPWRTYQKRVLDHIETHLSDNKIHVVAPPGSGKTVLGLELALRLNQPTLILAPSIAICQQWTERLRSDFNNGEPIDWLSTNIKKPALLTIATYQALHTASKDDFPLKSTFEKAGIKTIVLDECHHLQKGWWDSLNQLVDKGKHTVVALTATPPYDVSGLEWSRYHDLCGAIDEEINVPELVAEHNLCPHQDYIYFSTPTSNEAVELNSFREKLDDFLEFLQLNLAFKDILKQHPFLHKPEQNLEAIYENPSYFSSIMVLLNFLGRVIPASAIGIIGADETDIPKINLSWLEIFWNGALQDAYFINQQENPDYKKVIQHLKKIGGINRGKIQLSNPEKINTNLRSSTEKMSSILDIINIEYTSLKEDLRMVILTDYIRKEALPKNKLDVEPSNLIGVVPIFENIRKKYPIEIELGVLTGSLVIIPKYSEKLFDSIVKSKRLDPTLFRKKVLPHDDDYILIEAKESTKNYLVQIITELFHQGGITVLVGTKSLLGEGWDAPVINSLVLATVVGSYVYSNQMRGRAIRTLQNDKNKTSNIWHLVCIDDTDLNGGHDYKILKRRFRSFHGLSFHPSPTIKNGINRFNLPSFPLSPEKVKQMNSEMVIHAQNRKRLLSEWTEALKSGVRMTEEIKIPFTKTKRYKREHKLLKEKTHYDLDYDFGSMTNSLYYTLFIAVMILLFFSSFPMIFFKGALYMCLFSLLCFIVAFREKLPRLASIIKIIRSFKHKFKFKQLIILFFLVLIVGTCFYILKGLFSVFSLTSIMLMGFIFWLGTHKFHIFKSWNLYQIHGNTIVFFKKISTVLLDSLYQSGLINTKIEDLDLEIQTDMAGNIQCVLNNGTPHEEQLFMDSLQELMNPVDNARYLIAMESKSKDAEHKVYYALPTKLGRNKKGASFFYKNWKEELGDAELIFTRDIDGRLELLKARGQSFSLETAPEIMRTSKWL